MTITEPATLITDWMLGAMCAVLGWLLMRSTDPTRPGARSRRWLAAALWSTAVAAFVGGASHGFSLYLSATASFLIWKVTVLSIGLTSFLFLGAAAIAALPASGRRLLLGLGAIQGVAYAAWMLRHDEFIWVIADYVPAMTVVLVLQILDGRRGRASAPWLAGGVLASFVGAGIQASGFALHPSFNHNDLYHVVQMGATWLLYRGGMLLRDHGD